MWNYFCLTNIYIKAIFKSYLKPISNMIFEKLTSNTKNLHNVLSGILKKMPAFIQNSWNIFTIYISKSIKTLQTYCYILLFHSVLIVIELCRLLCKFILKNYWCMSLQSDKRNRFHLQWPFDCTYRLHAVGMFDTYSGTKSLILNYIYVQYGYYEERVIEDLDACRETHILGVPWFCLPFFLIMIFLSEKL